MESHLQFLSQYRQFSRALLCCDNCSHTATSSQRLLAHKRKHHPEPGAATLLLQNLSRSNPSSSSGEFIQPEKDTNGTTNAGEVLSREEEGIMTNNSSSSSPSSLIRERSSSSPNGVVVVIDLHKCGLCPYKTIRRGDLAKHKRTHTGEKPYVCRFCDYRSTTASPRATHERKVHGAVFSGGSRSTPRITVIRSPTMRNSPRGEEEEEEDQVLITRVTPPATTISQGQGHHNNNNDTNNSQYIYQNNNNDLPIRNNDCRPEQPHPCDNGATISSIREAPAFRNGLPSFREFSRPGFRHFLSSRPCFGDCPRPAGFRDFSSPSSFFRDVPPRGGGFRDFPGPAFMRDFPRPIVSFREFPSPSLFREFPRQGFLRDFPSPGFFRGLPPPPTTITTTSPRSFIPPPAPTLRGYLSPSSINPSSDCPTPLSSKDSLPIPRDPPPCSRDVPSLIRATATISSSRDHLQHQIRGNHEFLFSKSSKESRPVKIENKFCQCPQCGDLVPGDQFREHSCHSSYPQILSSLAGNQAHPARSSPPGPPPPPPPQCQPPTQPDPTTTPTTPHQDRRSSSDDLTQPGSKSSSSGKRRYPCRFCGFKSRTLYYRVAHERFRHRSNYPPKQFG